MDIASESAVAGVKFKWSSQVSRKQGHVARARPDAVDMVDGLATLTAIRATAWTIIEYVG